MEIVFRCNVAAIYGGVSINPQIAELREAEIAVGTPGRVLDHMTRDTLQADNIKILVLDEADRMLDMGFEPQISRIL
jgi:ATP-dependent RNA helicase DeaD